MKDFFPFITDSSGNFQWKAAVGLLAVHMLYSRVHEQARDRALIKNVDGAFDSFAKAVTKVLPKAKS